MQRILTLTLAIGFLLISNVKAAVSTINGTINGGLNQKVFFEEYIEGGLRKIDSVTLSKTGKFVFKLDHAATSYYRISLSTTNFAALIIKPGEKITFSAKANDLARTYTIKGSAYSSQLKEFSDLVINYAKERDTISARFKRAIQAEKTEESEKLGKELSAAYDNFLKGRNGFVDKYPASPALYAVVSHLNFNQEYDMLKKIETGLKASMPDSYFYKQVAGQTKRMEEVKANEEARIKEAERQRKMKENVAPGKPAPDIAMADSNGVVKSLSSLKGNVVLLDFWASWCGPCRGENPNVVRLYNKYKDKGFTVYSVSLDNDRKKWLTAIKKDQLTWPSHVSELKGWQTSVLPMYGISSIPFTVLIGKDGNIISTGLRGPTLEAKLKEIFGY